jgi:GrpB-like predicted nucleotidyltransferase (UPF0157 family)
MTIVTQYDKNWPIEFIKIKKYLQDHLDSLRIEHVGSTSIPKMLAKPIIDIDIVIDNINDLPPINDKLSLLGYEFIGDVGVVGRYAYANNQNQLYKHHLYVCLSEENGYLEHIAFRDYLIKHEDKRVEYGNLKKSIALKYPDNPDLYCESKTVFINECLKKSGYQKKQYDTLFPDFNNCLINITASIQKYFHGFSKYSSLDIVDELLESSDHVILMVLDGMGKVIIENNLDEKSFLRQNIKKIITSVFPPTTVAATTALISGKLPGLTGWVGWHQYFEKIDKFVPLFKHEEYYTGEIIEEDIVNQEIGYTPFSKDLKDVKAYELYPHFMPDGFLEFDQMCERLVQISNNQEKSYTYAYWDKPDHLIHDYGCYHQQIKNNLNDLNNSVENMSKRLGPKTTLIVTADHGLIDVKPIEINSFSNLTKHLKRLPAVEGRATVFYVNDKEAFKEEFNKYFSSFFDLYTQAEFIELGFLGDDVNKAIPFLGDFIAIAKRQYYFNAKKAPGSFVGAHAGITSDEMLVPLIIYVNK